MLQTHLNLNGNWHNGVSCSHTAALVPVELDVWTNYSNCVQKAFSNIIVFILYDLPSLGSKNPLSKLPSDTRLVSNEPDSSLTLWYRKKSKRRLSNEKKQQSSILTWILMAGSYRQFPPTDKWQNKMFVHMHGVTNTHTHTHTSSSSGGSPSDKLV